MRLHRRWWGWKVTIANDREWGMIRVARYALTEAGAAQKGWKYIERDKDDEVSATRIITVLR